MISKGWVARAFSFDRSCCKKASKLYTMCTTANLPTKILPKIRWLKTSGKSPLDMRVPLLQIRILLESNPMESRILVRRLAVQGLTHQPCLLNVRHRCHMWGLSLRGSWSWSFPWTLDKESPGIQNRSTEMGHITSAPGARLHTHTDTCRRVNMNMPDII